MTTNFPDLSIDHFTPDQSAKACHMILAGRPESQRTSEDTAADASEHRSSCQRSRCHATLRLTSGLSSSRSQQNLQG